MNAVTRDRLRRTCLFLAMGLAVWVGVAYYTGGFAISLGSFRLLSARGLRNPALLALLLAAAWWRLGGRGALHADLTWLEQVVAAAANRRGTGLASAAIRTSARTAVAAGRALLSPRLPLLVAAAATAAATLTGAFEGVFIAGGSDSYGYVSEAHLFAAGRMRVEEPLIGTLRDLAPPDAVIPLGYRPAPDGVSSVPAYAPGFPMLMTLFQWVGGRDAVFAAVPAMAGLLVWATFLLGRLAAGPTVGAAAAVLMLTSPSFLFQVVSPPMSDVPTAAWWTLSLALMMSASPAGALGAGAAAGAAVLTRPNLAPLAAIPLLVIAWPIVRRRTLEWTLARPLVAYSVPVAVAAAAVGVVNWALNGSPLLSGYGSLDGYYAWTNWAHNLDRYSRWLVETQTPLIALALAAPLVLRRPGALAGERIAGRRVRYAVVAFAAGVGLSYLFYIRLESWMFLRFLLPAFPIAMIFMSAVILAATRRLPRGWSGAVFAVTIGLLAHHGYLEARDHGVFFADTERKYALVGRYIAQRLPAKAAIITQQHSGSVRYYSGRAIVRWDYLDPKALDAVVARLREAGYEPYLLLEAWEISDFRRRFQTHHLLDVLNRPPFAHLPLGDIRLYSLASGPQPLPETIPDPRSLIPDP